MILKILKLHSPKDSCNFENFQNHTYLLITNCTRGRAISYTNSELVRQVEKGYFLKVTVHLQIDNFLQISIFGLK